MAFRDYSQQFAPVNVFGGLGKGLGEGLGRGVTKSIRRPLFRKLADKFRTENEAKAQLNTLAQMGLQAPPVQGDTQYPIFQDMMAQNLSVLNQRPDRAQELWETDPEAAQEYLLGEDKLYAAKGGKGAGKPSKQDLAQTPEALQVRAAIDKVNEAILAIQNNPKLKASEKNAKLGPLVVQRDNLVADYNSILEGKLSYMSPTQLAETVNKAVTAANAEGQIAEREVNAAAKILDKITAGASKFAAKVKPALEEMRKVYAAQKDVEILLRDYEAIKKDPNALFQAVKRLAQAIEPGLQVTEGEVQGFTGQNFFTDALGLIQSAKSGAKALFNSIPDAQVAAGRQSEKLLKKVLEQATRTIRATQEANTTFIDEYALSAAATLAEETGIRLMNNPLIPADQQKRIQEHAKSKVLGELPLAMLNPENFIAAIGAVASQLGDGGGDGDSQGTWNWQDRYKEGDLWPYAPNEKYSGPQTYPDGTEVSLTDDWRKLRANELEAKKGAGKGAKASPTKNPIKAQASAAAAEMSDKAVDDLLAQGGY